MRMHGSEKSLSWYEKEDIHQGGYVGWDVHGFPIKLFWDAQYGPQIRIEREKEELPELQAAIINYAKQYNPRSIPKLAGIEGDVVFLFNVADNKGVAH